MPLIDLTGREFGKLVVQYRVNCEVRGHSRWLCLCGCGQEIVVRSDRLLARIAPARSCGCLERACKHGHARDSGHTPEYVAWKSMQQRCGNPKNRGYANYGGRGISICSRWRGAHGFSNFFQDLGSRPSTKHSLERIDNDQGYCPENCKWALRKEQQRNRRQSYFVEFEGRTKLLVGLTDEFGIDHAMVYNRLRRGWPLLLALTVPALLPGQRRK